MKLSRHKLSELFAPYDLPIEELQNLAADILENGQREAIVLYEDGVLDGWNRHLACELVGVNSGLRNFDPSIDGDPWAFVVSKNIHRRHMRPSDFGKIFLSHQKIDPSRKIAVAREIAQTTGVSLRTAENIKAISDSTSAVLKDAVIEGKVSLARGAKLAKLPPSKIARDVNSTPQRPKTRYESPPIEEDNQPDIAAEFIALSSENDQLQKLNESLLKDDSKKEIQLWKEKFDAACGRVNQLLKTESEMKKQLDYQGRILAGIRKELGVEKTSEILPAIKEAMSK